MRVSESLDHRHSCVHCKDSFKLVIKRSSLQDPIQEEGRHVPAHPLPVELRIGHVLESVLESSVLELSHEDRLQSHNLLSVPS